jgi:hypothetical protein
MFQTLVDSLKHSHQLVNIKVLGEEERLLLRKELTVRDLRWVVFQKYGQPNSSEEDYAIYQGTMALDLGLMITECNTAVLFTFGNSSSPPES